MHQETVARDDALLLGRSGTFQATISAVSRATTTSGDGAPQDDVGYYWFMGRI